MPPPASSARKAFAALILLSLIWAYNWIMLKEGLRFADPFDFAALRTAPGALLLFAAMAYMKKPFAPVALPRLILLGLFQTTGFVCFICWALVAGAVGKTTVLVYTAPFWTLLFAWPMLGERIRGLQWLAVLLAAGGLTLVLEPWDLGGSFVSRVYAVLAGVCWAASSVIVKRWRNEGTFDDLSVTAWQIMLGSVVVIIIALLVPSRPVVWTGYFALVLIYGIVLGSVAGWLLWLYILKHLPAGIASLNMMAVPALGVLLSKLLYGEEPGGIEIAGMLLIGASLALLSWLTLCGRRSVTPEIGQE
ncbi:MAG: EamA family transporter [Burkholderiales bacterium]